MSIRNIFFTLLVRQIKTDTISFVINLTGLAIGLAMAAVTIVFVLDEWGYDTSFPTHQRVYRILTQNPSDNRMWASSPLPLGNDLSLKFDEIEACAPQYVAGPMELKNGDTFITEKGLICTSANFFRVFGIEAEQGSTAHFDLSPDQLMLSRSLARKYFGNADCTGKPLVMRYRGNEHTMMVAGVYDDFPANVTVRPSMMANMDFAAEHLAHTVITTNDTPPNAQYFKESWEPGAFFTNYLLLKENTDVRFFAQKLTAYGHGIKNNDGGLELSLQPLEDIYFGSASITDNNKGDLGNPGMLYLMASVGLAILVIACINYFNLASAQTLAKTRSLAVRKMCGAPRSSIVGQTLLESTAVCIMALPIAMALAHAVLPPVSGLLNKSYTLSMGRNLPAVLAFLGALAIAMGVVSGLAVSAKQASFSLGNALKGTYQTAQGKFGMQKAMVVFQMAVFIVLIATMALVRKQINYAFDKDLGFTKEGLLRVPCGDRSYDLLKQELAKEPGVLSVTGALWVPPHKGKMSISVPKADDPTQQVLVNGDFVDYGFVQTMGMKLIKGEDFTRGKHTSGVLVNETAVATLGLTDAVGEKTAFGTVVGVVSDFHMYSMREQIPPMIIGLNPSMCREMVVRVHTSHLKQTIASIRQRWEATPGTAPFDFNFTDDVLAQMYDSDLRMSQTIGLLAGIAVFIAAMGLFGLSVHACRQKTKEIGIRKVNGAKVSQIMAILNGTFIKWTALAFMVALPVAWYAMQKWLGGFVYKTSPGWQVFALAGLSAFGITLLTVSWQSWRAATRNPVETLRYE
ncbi:MAG: ABC transporter permease [Breznakibacter sp.]